MSRFHLHLISDSTGETLSVIARAVWVRFDLAPLEEHVYALTRTQKQVEDALEQIALRQPALVMCTLVDDALRSFLEVRCRKMNIPCIAVLDQIAETLSDYLGVEIIKRAPGSQHLIDSAYFDRLKALSYALAHDDGQQVETLDEADVILLGLSRTSKTPTCFYLAHRGIKAANVPIIPDMPLPDSLKKLTRPLIVGLILKPQRLREVRLQRFTQDLQTPAGSTLDIYTSPANVAQEVAYARQIFSNAAWPIIDVTQRSVEETAAAILNLKRERDEKINE